MKRRHIEPENQPENAVTQLAQALAALDDPSDVLAFLRDLCTPAELEAMADRWRVVPYLEHGMAYREIHDRTAVSVTTIGRIARCLLNTEGGYQIAIRKLKRKKLWPKFDAENAVEEVLK
jgi:TrpR-related protein YerC/YecD